MKIEEHNILDGQTWYHIKYDNTAPKTAFLFTYLPYNMDQAWTYEGGREHTANGGFTLTHKITHGENVIQEAEWVFDVKANDGSKFEMEHLHKMTMDTTLTLDGEKISEFVFDNTQAKKHIKFFYSPDAYTKDYLFTDEWEYPGHSGCKWNTELKRGDVSIWNWVGDYSFVNNANKFEMKTMDKIVQTEMSPFYGLDHFYLGRYYKTGGGKGSSPTRRRTGTSFLESSSSRTQSLWMARNSARRSLAPGPPPTPWSGLASPSEASSLSPGTSLARMR